MQLIGLDRTPHFLKFISARTASSTSQPENDAQSPGPNRLARNIMAPNAKSPPKGGPFID